MVRYCISLLATIVIGFFSISCTASGPTRPNASILDPEYVSQTGVDTAEAQAILTSISSQNELLAQELGKLPELQDGVNQKDVEALKNIQLFYQKNSDIFNDAFSQMYLEGIPEVRMYCTPLQAVFWLAEMNYFSYKSDVIEHYSLQNLIELAWNTPSREASKRMLKIIDEYRTEEDKLQALVVYSESSLSAIKWHISQDYHSGQNKFTDTGKKYILEEMSGEHVQTKDPRWTDYQVVTERINSPDLFDAYINKYMIYENIGPARGAVKMFKTGAGHCTDGAYLARHMMRRAGYETFIRSVRWGPDDRFDVHTASGVILKDGSYLLVADFGGIPGETPNTMGGPFRTLQEMDSRMSRGRPVIHSQWGAYFPPR